MTALALLISVAEFPQGKTDRAESRIPTVQPVTTIIALGAQIPIAQGRGTDRFNAAEISFTNGVGFRGVALTVIGTATTAGG